jgi:hypothetical protein
MRKIMLLVFLLLFPAISYAQPSVAFDAETYDFGLVTAGETIEHVFQVRNAGDKELIIEKLIPS